MGVIRGVERREENSTSRGRECAWQKVRFEETNMTNLHTAHGETALEQHRVVVRYVQAAVHSINDRSPSATQIIKRMTVY